jgi:bacterial/archaeal transporter family protein
MEHAMWEFFALSTALVWAIVTILDKVLLERYILSRNTYLILHGLIGLIPVLGLLLVGRGMRWDDLSMLALACLSGILESIFVFFYYKALQIADASVVAIGMQGVPVMTILISFLFLHEIFPLPTYLGITIIVLGTVLATLAKDSGQHRVDYNALWAVLPALLAISISYSLQSFVLRTINVDTLFTAARIGQLLVGLAMLSAPSVRKEFVAVTAKLSSTILLTTVCIGLLNLLGVYLLNEAYSLGPLALVTTLASVQPILVLLIVFAVNSVRPQTIPDQGGWRLLLPRAIATMLVIVGIYLASSTPS